MLRARALVFVVAVSAVVGSPAAAASSRDVAQRVLDQWKVAGAKGQLLTSRFVFDDETVLVPIPALEGGPCTHVAVVGARGLSFHAKLSDTSNDPLLPDTGARASSLAGVLELRRCDGGRAVRHVLVTSDAGRGALEIVVARSNGALPSLASVIPERTGGALPIAPEPGQLPALSPAEKRAEIAEARASREGASGFVRESVRAGEDGNGDAELTLPPGCHRVEVFAQDTRAKQQPARRFRLDVDAELRDLGDDRLLARDRTEAPDARLEACVGRATRVGLVFVGAPPESPVIVTRASWPMPIRLPALWGPTTRGKMARVVFARHVAVPAEEPVYLGEGASGTTPVPLSVEVGGCYVAVLGVTHGHARSLQLRAIVGTRESSDERGAAEEAALAAFCVSAQESARIEVQARGSGVQWGLAVYRVKSGVWEAGR